MVRNKKSISKSCDVLIIGGGPVGGTLACALAQCGFDVIIIDRINPETALKTEFDGRTSAIAYGSRNILQGLSIWPSLGEEAEPILDIHVSCEKSHGFTHYDHKDINNHPLGYIVENNQLRKAIYTTTFDYKNLHWQAPATVVKIRQDKIKVLAELDNGALIEAFICIAADGKNSEIRRSTNIPTVEWSYDQTAIVGIVEHELPHKNMAFEHFLINGPFALLPMTGNRSSLVWTEKSDVALTILKLSDSDFNIQLQDRFGEALGKLRFVGKRWSYKLNALIAKRYFEQRTVLVGDAAHAIHPVAGQGLNLGFRDVAALSEVFVDADRLGLDFGSEIILEKYQRWRRMDNLTLTAMTDGIVRVFSNDLWPLRVSRGKALDIINKIPFAKRFFMRHAMGLVGRLPRLIAGKPL
jgi:2-octaprenyl-6-methoxyphenol hydroxylase